MKNKLIITLLIFLTLLSCILLYLRKKQEPVEPMPTVESIVEETTVETETTTEEVETTTEQGTVEGSGEEPVIIEEEAKETVTDGVDSTSTDVILGEDEYKGDEPEVKSFDEATQGVLADLKEMYEAGEITKEEYDAFVKEVTGLNNLVNDLQNSQPGHIDKDVPGGTPGDPSKDGTKPYNPNIEVPPELQGSFH